MTTRNFGQSQARHIQAAIAAAGVYAQLYVVGNGGPQAATTAEILHVLVRPTSRHSEQPRPRLESCLTSPKLLLLSTFASIDENSSSVVITCNLQPLFPLFGTWNRGQKPLRGVGNNPRHTGTLWFNPNFNSKSTEFSVKTKCLCTLRPKYSSIHQRKGSARFHFVNKPYFSFTWPGDRTVSTSKTWKVTEKVFGRLLSLQWAYLERQLFLKAAFPLVSKPLITTASCLGLLLKTRCRAAVL